MAHQNNRMHVRNTYQIEYVCTRETNWFLSKRKFSSCICQVAKEGINFNFVKANSTGVMDVLSQLQMVCTDLGAKICGAWLVIFRGCYFGAVQLFCPVPVERIFGRYRQPDKTINLATIARF